MAIHNTEPVAHMTTAEALISDINSMDSGEVWASFSSSFVSSRF